MEGKKKMKAISLKQPWADLIKSGAKTIETRVWKTDYRGDLLICSSQKVDKEAMEYFRWLFAEHELDDIKLGHAICVAELFDCRLMTKDDETQALCDVYGLGRWKAKSFLLRNIRPIKPFPIKGQLNIFDIDVKPEELIFSC
jgi:hypothetical protein